MQTPPAVQIDTQANAAWRRCMLLLAGLGTLSSLSWSVSAWTDHDPALMGVGLGLCILSLALSIGSWRDAAQIHRLCWNGQTWLIEPLPSSCASTAAARQIKQPQVMIDLGHWLLLRLTDTSSMHHHLRPQWSSATWIALTESDHRPAWHALRCALYATNAQGTPESAKHEGVRIA